MEALAGYGSSSEDTDSESDPPRQGLVSSSGVPNASAATAAGGAERRSGAAPALPAAKRPTPPVCSGGRLPDAATLLSAAAGPGPIDPSAILPQRRPCDARSAGKQHAGDPLQQPKRQQLQDGDPNTEDTASQPPPQRIRSFPHVEGVFPTVVYIKLPQHKAVSDLFQHLLASLPTGHGLPRFYPLNATTPDSHPKRQQHPPQGGTSNGPSPPAATVTATAAAQPPPPPPVPPHISLSRTVGLPKERERALLSSLRTALAGASPAALRLRGVVALVNDDRTRTFAALKVERGEAEVRALIAAVDAAFAEHGLQTFYADPLPHASFAWALGDHGDALTAALAATPPPHEPLEAPVVQVVCRVLHRESVVWSGALGGGRRGGGRR